MATNFPKLTWEEAGKVLLKVCPKCNEESLTEGPSPYLTYKCMNCNTIFYIPDSKYDIKGN